MAVKIAVANGNLTIAGTWATVDSTSLLDSEAANTVLTTAYVESATFTPGAITIDGIAVKVATRAAVAAGTITVRLAQAGALVAGTEYAINVSDLESRDGEQGWYFFKFAAPVTLLAATLYTVSAKTSNATQVNLYRNATAGNWARMLRTTTTGAPAAGDSMHILGEWTAAATKTDRTVTMDSTAATDYGDGTASNPPGFTIGKGGILTWGAIAATNYILQLSTRLVVYRGGIYNQGTTGTPCPRDSTQVLQFDCASDGDFGLLIYGTANAQGQSRSAGKLIAQCLLNTDEAAAQTALGVDTDTGWLNGDDIAIAPTSRTFGQGELRTLSGAAAAASVTVSAGLTNAHSGTSPTQAEVILLTRNVRIRSVSTTAMAYIVIAAAATVDIDWVEFRYLGTSTTGKRGIQCDTTAAGGGSVTFSYCSLRDFEWGGLWADNADADNFIFEQCVGWNIAQGSTEVAVFVNSQSQTAFNWRVSDLTLINCGALNGYGFSTRNLAGTVSNLRISGSGVAGVRLEPTSAFYGRTRATVPWSGLELHTNGAYGIEVNNVDEFLASSVNSWRNATAGIWIVSTAFIQITSGAIFGNGNGVHLNGSAAGYKWVRLRSVAVSGDTSFAQTAGIVMVPGSTHPCEIELDNCTFGVVSGIKVAHTNDFEVSTGFKIAWVTLRNTLLASATEFNNVANLHPPSYIKYQKVDQATLVNKTFYPLRGTVQYDAVTIHGTTPSESLTPLSTFLKLETGPKRANIASAGTVAISCYVRKSAAYTGNAPRLMQRANPAIGILTDTVIATFSAAADTWQQLSGTTAAASEAGVVEFYVDCDGAAGLVYVGDWVAA